MRLPIKLSGNQLYDANGALVADLQGGDARVNGEMLVSLVNQTVREEEVVHKVIHKDVSKDVGEDVPNEVHHEVKKRKRKKK